MITSEKKDLQIENRKLEFANKNMKIKYQNLHERDARASN